MALTIDEKKEILELYGKGYSQRKIADKLGYSERTVGKVIREAAEEVMRLKSQGMSEEQIAIQLDYTIAFVEIAIKKYGDKLIGKEETKAEVKAEGTAGEIESPKKLDLKAELSEFQKDLEIEQRKEDIRDEVKGLINLLEDSETDYKKTGVFDTAYDTRQKALKREIEDFILTRVAEIHSIEAVSELEGIIKEIDVRIEALLDEYDKKASESVKARKTREKELSDKLLNSKIDIPFFPEFVKKQIKDRFLVRNVEEASTITDALDGIALLIMKDSNFNREQEEKMWHTFIDIVKEGGWSYLKRMAAKYRDDTEKMLVSINVCPSCESKLIRRQTEDKVIISCPHCGKSYWMPRS